MKPSTPNPQLPIPKGASVICTIECRLLPGIKEKKKGKVMKWSASRNHTVVVRFDKFRFWRMRMLLVKPR